jgi:tight adherence protein B
VTAIVALTGALGALLLYRGLTEPPGTRGRSLAAPLERLARDSGVAALSPPRLLAASVACFALAAVVVAGLTSSLSAAAALALGAGWAPIAWTRARAERRRRRLREVWADGLATLIAGVRAGIALAESCADLATRGPMELRPAFASFAATYRASGSFPAALRRLRDELCDPVGDRVVAALALAHEVGGTDLVRVLRTLADFVRDDVRVRKEVEARWSWTVTAARVAAAAPWAVLLLMSSRPEAAAAYDSRAGIAVICGGAAATLLGYRLMLRAAQLPRERRLGE